jgi:hypothetical protein
MDALKIVNAAPILLGLKPSNASTKSTNHELLHDDAGLVRSESRSSNLVQTMLVHAHANIK